MPDTLYASNPSVPASPHPIEGVEEIPNGITPEQYYRALSRRPMTDSEDEETAESVFREHISPIVDGRCIGCHVEGGQYTGDRLIFARSSEADHEAHNYQVFADFVASEDDGATTILSKIRGENHDGLEQVPADSENYTHFEQFLQLLVGEEETASGTVTAQNLFDGVGFREDRKVLRQAAVIFAGRVPTDSEYESLTEIGLRSAIRNLMTGPGFHDFLIRASNDRLLTDREPGAIPEGDSKPFIELSNKVTERCEAKASGADDLQLNAMRRWLDAAQFASVRAPLELIAHVAANDLPYTEILTADYVMANPQGAEAYGADTKFDDPSDVFEFRPSRFVHYYLNDDSRIFREKTAGTNCQHYILDPGNLDFVYPHAGILNSPVFMIRYPTTATNRNRARSRWTYYHFLGFDIEKSQSRETDPDALADTNNPTLNNPACTRCHTIMDPVAGAYQNYDEEGNYRQHDGGMNSLDGAYKSNPAGGEEFLIEARAYDSRQTVASEGYLKAGHNTVGLRFEYLGQRSHVGIATVSVRNSDGDLIDRYHAGDLGPGRCGGTSKDYGGVFRLRPGCVLGVPLTVPDDDFYVVDIEAWNWHNDGGDPSRLKVWVPGYIYQEGDTWYRDMLPPGFKNTRAPSNDNSVQWLAQQIIEDDRFAEATVKFWWPALHGNEVSTTPPTSRDVDFEGRQIAAIAQDTEVKRLAQAFRTGIESGDPYNLKDLLVEMVISDWFRAESIPDGDPVRADALLNAGAKRLLTPEELASKTLALTGVQWGRHWRRSYDELQDEWNKLGGPLNILYGGIDSDGVTERAHDLTPVMASVAKSHAVELSCPIVMRELFLLPDEERLLFRGFDREVTPISEFGETFTIFAASRADIESLTVEGSFQAGDITIKLAYLNDYWGGREEDRDILLDRLVVHQDDEIVFDLEMEDHEHHTDCHHIEQDAFHLSSSGPDCVLAIPVDIPIDGSYSITLTAWGDQAGDEAPRLAINVVSDTVRSAGSMTIRNRLVNLHDKLLGVEVTTDSAEIAAAYEFYVDLWNRNRGLNSSRFMEGLDCRWWEIDDSFLEGILSGYRLESEEGYSHHNKEAIKEFMESIDFTGPNNIARTWTVVLMSMLMDQRYLHL